MFNNKLKKQLKEYEDNIHILINNQEQLMKDNELLLDEINKLKEENQHLHEDLDTFLILSSEQEDELVSLRNKVKYFNRPQDNNLNPYIDFYNPIKKDKNEN
jgi:regulator of replication initiation timing